jgi:hypothetical protein
MIFMAGSFIKAISAEAEVAKKPKKRKSPSRSAGSVPAAETPPSV